MSTQKIDYIKTLSIGKIKILINYSNMNDSNDNFSSCCDDKKMSLRDLSYEENTFGDNNDINIIENNKFIKNEGFNSENSSINDKKIRYIPKTIRKDSKEKLEFQFTPYFKENKNNIKNESEIFDSDLTEKILNI